ncbi:hypothetical protein [Marinobacter sp.]|uniref:hypothetical protein n=1 Tax=Marinobacter sp. TaxID=50741 RepID=UPI002B276F83|nr:hypothetical protein [Marinobacter sp.]
MDPISYVFSAYLNAVQTGVEAHFSESRNIHVTPVEIVYEGETIAFQHQIWRIRDQSVCGNVRQDLQRFSKCTMKAKRLFGELCSELSKGVQQDPKRAKLRAMYCNASMSFKPTIASVGSATETNELDSARQACNAATVAAMGSRESALLRKKKELCEAYGAMKAAK